MKRKYLLILEKEYDVILNTKEMEELNIVILENIIDNLVDLLKSYNIEDDEILEQFTEQTEVEEVK